MAEETRIDSGTVPQQKSGVSPTLFWIVTIVLAVGIGAVYMLLDKKLDDSTSKLNEMLKNSAAKQEAALAKQTEEIRKTITESTTKQEALNKQTSELITKGQTDAAKLLESLTTLDKKVVAQTTETTKSFKEVEGSVLETKKTIGIVDNRVTYLDKEVKALQTTVNGLTTKIDEIKVGSAELKADQAKLLNEIKSVSGRSDVTQTELASLVQRTKDFELRVLLERAKQAAADAEKFDYANLFEKMENFGPRTAPKK